MCFDNHKCFSQSEESKCMWTHSKDGVTWKYQLRSNTFLSWINVKIKKKMNEKDHTTDWYWVNIPLEASICLFVYSQA